MEREGGGASRWLAAATGAMSLVLLASLVVVVADRQGRDEEASFLRAVERAEALDARLDNDIARARLGIVAHFDDLVRNRRETLRNLRSLEHPPDTLDAADRREVQAHIDAYRALVDEKSALVERFKTDLAVLRNGLRLLPAAADRLAEDPGVAPAERALLEHLLDVVLLVVVDPTPSRSAAARCALLSLAGGAPPDEPACAALPGPARAPGEAAVPPSAAAPLEPVRSDGTRPSGPVGEAILRHADVVVSGQAVMDDRVEVLLTLPVEHTARDLRAAYVVAHAQLVRRRQLHLLLFLGSGVGVLAFGSGTLIARLRETARRLATAHDALQIERDRVLELAEVRSRFVSMTSHEFRTPLSLIRSSTDLLESYAADWPPDRRQRHISRIQDAVHHMTEMLERVLLVGRAEAGRLEVRMAPVDLSALADQVVEAVRAEVGWERRLERVGDVTGVTVVLDESLVRQALVNLLHNAFKYSEADTTVWFALRHDERSVIFEIVDEGIGIPETDRPRLFDPFQRATNAAAFKGSGLGLAVAKRSVDVHGGSLVFESQVGRGTRFSVRLPRTPESTCIAS